MRSDIEKARFSAKEGHLKRLKLMFNDCNIKEYASTDQANNDDFEDFGSRVSRCLSLLDTLKVSNLTHNIVITPSPINFLNKERAAQILRRSCSHLTAINWQVLSHSSCLFKAVNNYLITHSVNSLLSQYNFCPSDKIR
jgi:hypothetical protein